MTDVTGEGDEAIPPIDFNTFVLSMSTAGMSHMNLVEGVDGIGEPNLPMARQTIEILEMLEQKTEGNLSGEEERILSQVLADLRDAYERAASAG